MAARSIRWPAACCRSRLGEATKTVPFVMDGRKEYRFTLRFGAGALDGGCRGRGHRHQRPASDRRRRFEAPWRPSWARSSRCPPAFSALKIEGRRAYDLARAGEPVALKPRRVLIERLELFGRPDTDHADFVVSCGKGTYIRSLGRDLALRSGDRRTPVGAASDGRRTVSRRGGHFASQTGGPRAYSRASRGPGPRRDRAGRHPGAGPDGGPSGPAAPRPAGVLDPGTHRRPAHFYAPRPAAGWSRWSVRTAPLFKPVRVFNL